MKRVCRWYLYQYVPVCTGMYHWKYVLKLLQYYIFFGIDIIIPYPLHIRTCTPFKLYYLSEYSVPAWVHEKTTRIFTIRTGMSQYWYALKVTALVSQCLPGSIPRWGRQESQDIRHSRDTARLSPSIIEVNGSNEEGFGIIIQWCMQ